MKIILYVNSFLPTVGGREMVVHYLAKAYQELGHDVRVFGASGWRKNRNLDLGYSVCRYPTMNKVFPNQIRMLQLLGDAVFRGCDVVHAHITYPAGYISAHLKKIKNIPLVITPHGNDIHVIPELGHGLRLDPEKDKKIKFALEKAELLTAISESIETSMLEAGAMKGKIRAIPNGVDIERFENHETQGVYSWLGVSPSSKLIVTVGNYNPRKGQDVLVRAMPEILKAVPQAVLVIVGGRTDALQPLINELGVSNAVILTGAVKPPTIHQPNDEGGIEDRLADIYLSSSVYVSAGVAEGSEGLSLAVLEALASGLPVVASDISGNRDIVVDNENGFLVKPGSPELLAKAVLAVLQDPNRQKKMSGLAKAVAEKYRWKRIATMYLDVYEEAAGILS